MRLRFLLLLSFALPALASLACGLGYSQSPGPDGGGCVGSAPSCGYGTCGDGDPLSASCVNGAWACPYVGLPACPVADDAGVDACSTDPFLDCPLPDCTGVDELPSCTAGQWSCIAVGECEEDAGEDAGEDAAPPPPASFACGDLACTTATTYCQIDTGGAALADGGVESWYACNALPSFCGGGAALTCECGGIQWLSPACGCITDNGVMIITCAEP